MLTLNSRISLHDVSNLCEDCNFVPSAAPMFAHRRHRRNIVITEGCEQVRCAQGFAVSSVLRQIYEGQGGKLVIILWWSVWSYTHPNTYCNSSSVCGRIFTQLNCTSCGSLTYVVLVELIPTSCSYHKHRLSPLKSQNAGFRANCLQRPRATAKRRSYRTKVNNYILCCHDSRLVASSVTVYRVDTHDRANQIASNFKSASYRIRLIRDNTSSVIHRLVPA